MKANKLTLGDHVQVNGEACKVISISYFDIGISDSKEDFYHVHIDNIKPLPITAEILEKNFVKNGTNRYVVYGGNSYIKDMTNFFELHINFVDFKLEQQIFYVHKLQQALRLCGIEKEIEI